MRLTFAKLRKLIIPERVRDVLTRSNRAAIAKFQHPLNLRSLDTQVREKQPEQRRDLLGRHGVNARVASLYAVVQHDSSFGSPPLNLAKYWSGFGVGTDTKDRPNDLAPLTARRDVDRDVRFGVNVPRKIFWCQFVHVHIIPHLHRTKYSPHVSLGLTSRLRSD